jgi:ATP-dependent Clp protease protease subunit
MIVNPIAIESNTRGEKQYDCYSRLFNKNRTIFLVGEIEEELVTSVISQLLYLDSVSDEQITMLINSPGGVITDGFSLVDVMRTISSPVRTVCIGQAASMGAFILSCGTKGQRYALPNSRILFHQPLSGVQGQVTDIGIHYKEVTFLKERLYEILSENTGQKKEDIYDKLERDYWMSPKEALEFGAIDFIKEKPTN